MTTNYQYISLTPIAA